MTSSVTEADVELFNSTVIALRTFSMVRAKQRAHNQHWQAHIVDCHSIARLISRIFPSLKLKDGFVVGVLWNEAREVYVALHTCHSWLETPNGAIIDPYPMGVIASGSALLVPHHGDYCAHGAERYREDPRVKDHFDVRHAWRRARSHQRCLKQHTSEQLITEAIQSLDTEC